MGDLVYSTLPFSALPWSDNLTLSDHHPLALSALANFSSSARSTIFVDSALVNLLVESNSISTTRPLADSDSVGGPLLDYFN